MIIFYYNFIFFLIYLFSTCKIYYTMENQFAMQTGIKYIALTGGRQNRKSRNGHEFNKLIKAMLCPDHCIAVNTAMEKPA